MIDRFKKEKIAWHFKSKEDYVKVLEILEKYGITFNNNKNGAKDYFDIYEEFGIAYYGGFGFSCLDYFKSNGYEIIEIMNPVYVPMRIEIDLVNGTMKKDGVDIWCQPKLVNGWTELHTQYKGIDCELMYQEYQKVRAEKIEIEKLKLLIKTKNEEIDLLTKKLQEYIEIYELLKYNISNFEKK